jgi:branched-chain amino acid transport system substrate-binding protein
MRRILTTTAAMTMSLGFASAAFAGPECGANTGEAATGEPLIVGGIHGDAAPGDFSGATDGAAAYFKCVNANGGIHGRPVDYRVENDQWNPELAAQAAAKLVYDDNAIALIGNGSVVEMGVNYNTYKEAGIMAMAAACATSECYDTTNIVATNQGPLASGLGATKFAMEELGVTNIACVSLGVANSGGWACDGVANYAREKGGDSFPIFLNPAAPDVNSGVLEILAGGADGVVLIMPAGLGVAVLKAAEEQDLGDALAWTSATPLYDVAVPGALGPYWAGRVYVNAELTPSEKSSPDMDNWNAVFDTYGTENDRRDTFNQAGYLTAKVFTNTLLAMDPADIDQRAKVTAAIRDIKGFKTDLMCDDYSVGDFDKYMPNTAGYMTKVVEGGFEIVRDCYEYDSAVLAEYIENRASLK